MERKIGSMMKDEEVELDMPPGVLYSGHVGGDGASSSGVNLRASLIDMGFLPILVDKVIKEKGEDDFDLLLETLISFSADQQSNSQTLYDLNGSICGSKNKIPLGCGSASHPEKAVHMLKSSSSDSLDSIFGDEKDEKTTSVGPGVHPKPEPILLDEEDDDQRESLLKMNFSVKEVDFAIDKLGKDAPVYELVDFIVAAQIAENEEMDFAYQESNPEALFGTMDRTLRLLELGFSEEDVSAALERFGPDVPIQELADWICSGRPVDSFVGKAKDMSGYYEINIKTEDSSDCGGQTDGASLGQMYEEKVPKEEYDDGPNSLMIDFDLGDIKGKRPIQELDGTCHSSSRRVKKRPMAKCKTKLSTSESQYGGTQPDTFSALKSPDQNGSYKGLDKILANPPYFLYGNVMNIPDELWRKMSQFLFAIEPEYVNTQFFSALGRKEGYIHNLPHGDRSFVEPKSPLTIEEAMPHTKKWWPSWDTRKHLSCISSETTGLSQMCENLRRILTGCPGSLSPEQQKKVLHYCRTLNLIWVGPDKLSPTEPEHLERILGYPIHHTKSPEIRLSERLEALGNCFQTDTLGYHLSVLKSLFPDGLTLLSIYSGIGGAEVALHRLGIRLKGVVSVESCEMKRRMLRQWWESSGQSGELVQLEDVQRLSSSKLEYLNKKFEGIDLIVGQNPSIGAGKAGKGVQRFSEAAGFDFTSYCEFVRVVQRVRSITGMNR